jgi:hypothetical protein
MNFDVKSRTIYLVRHGSHAYGTNTPSSDIDYKGVCVPPKEILLGFAQGFEQYERYASKGHECDITVYSLQKFMKLARDCNPNIIEVLFVDKSDVIECTPAGESLLESRDLFLSKKIRHTFSGYAHAQLKRIETHRKWLLDPPDHKPERSEFGLPEQMKFRKDDFGAFEALIAAGAELPMHVADILNKEKQYQAALQQFKQYETWKSERNRARAETEAKFGYDTKHAYHLLRLMRMCKEILTTGRVIVKRPDAEELVGIRNGSRSYDDLLAEAKRLDDECGELYEMSKVLPHSPNDVALNDLCVSITDEYLKAHS